TARRFLRLISGEAFTCGVLHDDGLYCWGRGTEGQHGGGTTVNSASPLPAAGARRFLSVAAGTAHVCGVDVARALWCWGRNTDGQVGTTGEGPETTAVRLLAGEGFGVVAAGARHGCALGYPQALAWCWGANESGQLGRATGGARGLPERVSGSLRLADLAATETSTCGVTAEGELYCWGAMGGAQPTRIASPAPLVSLSDGGLGRHLCALAADGRAFCWGAGADGQLGDGAALDRGVPTAVTTTARFRALATGPRNSCGVTLDNRLLCWGSGSLGAGAGVHRSDVPVPVAEPREGTEACPEGGCLP
ncbi:MAG TPA: hypothetical protein VMK65_00430, partial [Longimicrobiales bacterium]|nr:hypothetical protein [Longimicrobiales bacterium]